MARYPSFYLLAKSQLISHLYSSNMLYPKEDPDTHRLQFACRTCQYSEEATSACVFRNVLNNAVGETAGVTQDVGADPTVGLPLCLLCGVPIVCPGKIKSNDGGAADETHQEIKDDADEMRKLEQWVLEALSHDSFADVDVTV